VVNIRGDEAAALHEYPLEMLSSSSEEEEKQEEKSRLLFL
jgi:hypothetical protein